MLLVASGKWDCNMSAGDIVSAAPLTTMAVLFAAACGRSFRQTHIVCRAGATQLALLDRVAGTSGLAASFAASVQSLRQMEQQLADIALLGDEEEREELQELITEVDFCSGNSKTTSHHNTPQIVKPTQSKSEQL